MKKKLNLLLTVLLVVALMFALVACTGPQGEPGENGVGTAGPQGPQGPPGKDAESEEEDAGFNYYAQKFEGVGYENAFKTFTYNDFYYLLSKTKVANSYQDAEIEAEGDYVILFAGAWDSNSQLVMSAINAAALKAGITVYVFDPMLDGNMVLEKEIVGVIGSNAVDSANIGRVGYTGVVGTGSTTADFVYDNFNINDINFNATTTGVSALNTWLTTGDKFTTGTERLEAPLLVHISRSTSGGVAVSQIENRIDWSADVPASVAALLYKAQLSSFFGNVTNEGVFNAFMMNVGVAGTGGAVNIGGYRTQMTENRYFTEVSYAELLALMEYPGDHMIMFGGIWCQDTSAIFESTHKAAEASGFEGNIYFFDPLLLSPGGTGNPSIGSMRNNETVSSATSIGNHAKLYTYLLEEYYTGYESLWNNIDSITRAAAGGTAPATATYTINSVVYPKMCVPNVMLYNNAVTGPVKGIVDEHESECNSGITNSGTLRAEARAWARENLGYLFAKFGFAEAFINDGYAVVSNYNGLDCQITATKGTDSLSIFTFAPTKTGTYTTTAAKFAAAQTSMNPGTTVGEYYSSILTTVGNLIISDVQSATPIVFGFGTGA